MFYRALRVVLSFLARVIFRPQVRGAEKVPASGPVILAINHLAAVDSFVVPMVLRRQVSFLAKAEYFEKGSKVGPLFKALGAIPVQRDHRRAALAALESAKQVLLAGGVFAIHPEGTRSLDGNLHRGRTGVAQLVVDTNAVVVPVGLIGTDKVQPAGRRLPRPGARVVVNFGDPIDFSRYQSLGSTPAVRRAITDEIMYAIMDLSGQVYVDTYHERPGAA